MILCLKRTMMFLLNSYMIKSLLMGFYYNNKNFFSQQVACLTANKNYTSGTFLKSTSQSFYNKFSSKEFSTLLCLRYNLDLDYIPTNLPCTCGRKNEVAGNLQPKIADKKGFHICKTCNSDGCPTIVCDASKRRCLSLQKWRLSCSQQTNYGGIGR